MSPLQSILAILISFGIPGLFLLLIYTQDLYASRTFRLVLACFAWGGIGGLGLAYLFNTYVAVPIIFDQGWDIALLFVVFAPVAEELLKSGSLYYVSRQPEFTYFVDGAIYGFAAGIGFSITENILYMTQNPSAGIGLVLVRSFSTCLMHGTAAALVGAAVGRFRFQHRAGKWLALAGGWIAAILLHAGFNGFSYSEVVSQGIAVPIAVAIGLLGVGLIAWFINIGLKEEKVWMAETLDRKVGVTSAEVRAAQGLGGLHEVLQPILERFPKKAEQVEDLVLSQAQLGIKRKVHLKIADPQKKQQMEIEIAQLQAHMEALRKEVGGYVMVYLRSVFPEGARNVWGNLEHLTLESSPELRKQWEEQFARIGTGASPEKEDGLFAKASGRLSESQENNTESM